MKEILEPRKRPEVVRVEVPPTPMPDAVTAEEYAADVAVDDAEVGVVEDPPVSFDAPECVPEYVADEVRELAASAMAEVEGRLNETPEAEVEETLDHDPDGCDECLAAEAAEKEVHPEPEPRPPEAYEFRVKAASLKAWLAQVDVLADVVRVVMNAHGFATKTVDPAHIAMVEVALRDPVDALEWRDGKAVALDHDVEVGIDVPKVIEVVKKAKKDEVVRIRADLPDDKDKGVLTFEVGSMRRTMTPIDTAGMSDPQVPAMSLPATIGIDAKALLDAVKACDTVSDHVVLTVTRDGLNVFAEGDVDKVSIDFPNDRDEAEVDLGGNGDTFRSIFPLDYVENFLKSVKDERLTLRMGTDYPLRAEWSGTTTGTYLLAPRIESSSY